VCQGRAIGVLESTGCITKHLREMTSMIIVKKEAGAIVCYDVDPERLLDKLEHISTKSGFLPDT